MLKTCMILRDAAAIPTAGPMVPTSRPSAESASVSAAPVPVVEVAELSPADLRTVARESNVRAVAQPMPLMPIRQMAAGDSVAADPMAGASTWGVKAVRADQSAMTGAGVTACVIDSGIDRNHPAFAGVTLVEHDFSGSGNGDTDGHGTHCAGTIFGRSVNGTRIGVAPGISRALIARVFDNNGGGDTLMLFSAIQWAADNGADIVSMSLGFDFERYFRFLLTQGLPQPAAFSTALGVFTANLRFFDRLLSMLRAQSAFGRDLLIVAASGNESNRPTFEVGASLPAASEGVISVGAVAPEQAGRFPLANFSNTNPNLVGPGVGIHSARAGGQDTVALSGTSMATPHAAGVAALWWEKLRAEVGPGVPIARSVEARLLASARRGVFASGDTAGDFGEGMLTAP